MANSRSQASLRETPKLLPALVKGSHCGRELVLPLANALEAALVRDPKLKLAEHLRQVYGALNDWAVLPAATDHASDPNSQNPADPDGAPNPVARRHGMAPSTRMARRPRRRILPKCAASSPPSGRWKSPPPANMGC